MKPANLDISVGLPTLGRLTEDHFVQQQHLDSARIDQLFVTLLIVQWAASVTITLTLTPFTWAGSSHWIHPHVWAACLLGGGIVCMPLLLSSLRPGAPLTRHALAVGQMLLGSLWIHLSNGRIESHFHIFGSLAFLASYRDWRVLVTASAVAIGDHFLRGHFWPESIYGIAAAQPWRWAEHAGWILFTDAFLIPACRHGERQMIEIARGRGLQELAQGRVEEEVRGRTAELIQVNRDLSREIADRRATEIRLRASEERFALAVRGSSDGIWDWNCLTGEVYFSARFKELLGYLDDEFGDTLENLDLHMHPDERVSTWSKIHEHLEERTFHEVEFRLRLKCGSYRWFQGRGQAVWGDDGRATRMVGSICDITERKESERQIHDLNARLELRLRRMDALQTIDKVTSSSLNLEFTLEISLEQIVSSLGVDAAAIWLCDPSLQELERVASRGFKDDTPPPPIAMGEGLVGRAALRREAVRIRERDDFDALTTASPSLVAEGLVSYRAIPLLAKGRIKGVLEICHRSRLEPDAEWEHFLKAHATRAAIALEDAQLFESLERSNLDLSLAYDATIEGWSRALDLRDKETEGHTLRVTTMALRLARAIGMSGPELVHLRRGALLHDIGKMGVPDAILLKPGPLTPEEWVIMKRHPTSALEMLSPIAFLKPALDIPYAHHEKWDGTGYPRGLKGEEIPLAARVFAAADIWDALANDRPYRKAWARELVLDYIVSISGTHLDPQVVRAVVELYGDPREHEDLFTCSKCPFELPNERRKCTQKTLQEPIDLRTSLHSRDASPCVPPDITSPAQHA